MNITAMILVKRQLDIMECYWLISEIAFIVLIDYGLTEYLIVCIASAYLQNGGFQNVSERLIGET